MGKHDDDSRMDSQPEKGEAVSGTIEFGDFKIGYDAFAHWQSGELMHGSIQIMEWKMEGEDWRDDQLRKVFLAIQAALHECESSIEDQISEAHTVRRYVKILSGKTA